MPVDVPRSPLPSFSSLGVPEALIGVLAQRGITEPFPIQAATLPDTLAGRDVLGRGRTGSGKTVAFCLPLVARLAGGTSAVRRRPRALILAPTRELVGQITASLEPLATAAGLRVTTIFGGVSQHRQVQALDAGVDVVVACPGRLEDLMGQKLISLDAVQVTVLDEADHMADLGFLPGVRRILTATPAGGQRMLFSATLDNGVDALVKRFLSAPLTHSVDTAQSPVEAMTHHVFHLDGAETKRAVVERLASGAGRRVLFTRTKHQAKKLAKQLTLAGIPAVELHGNLSQNARERNLAAFQGEGVRVLVATDIAARGIHVDEVELVVHVDPPVEHKAYLHRSGRTARAGARGDVVTLVLPEQVGETRSLLRAAAISVQPKPVGATSPALEFLAGPAVPRVAPTAVTAPAHVPSGGGRRRGGSGGGPTAGPGGGSGQRPGGQRGSGRGARTGQHASAGGSGGAMWTSETGRPSGQPASGSRRSSGQVPAAPRGDGAVRMSVGGGRRRGR